MDTRRLDLLRVLGDGADYAMVDRLLDWLDSSRAGIQVSDIMGLSEVAKMMGVSRQAVWNWTNDPSRHFPKPIIVLSCGPIFARPQVETWKTGNTD